MSDKYATQMLYCRGCRQPTIHRPYKIKGIDNSFKLPFRCQEIRPGTARVCNSTRTVDRIVPIGLIHPDDAQHRHRRHGTWCEISTWSDTGRSRP